MRNRRGWSVFIVLRQHDIDPVGGEHLERAGQGRLREWMGVDAQEERPVGFLLSAVETNGLGDGQDVPSLKERSKEEPRWPEVPKVTRCSATRGSGRPHNRR